MLGFSSLSETPLSSLPIVTGNRTTTGSSSGVATVYGFTTSSVVETFAIFRGMSVNPVSSSGIISTSPVVFLESFV